MSKFICCPVYDGDPNNPDPVDWCVVGEGKLWISVDEDDVKEQALNEFPNAEFIEGHGWVLSGEEYKLLDKRYYDDIIFSIMLKENAQP